MDMTTEIKVFVGLVAGVAWFILVMAGKASPGEFQTMLQAVIYGVSLHGLIMSGVNARIQNLGAQNNAKVR